MRNATPRGRRRRQAAESKGELSRLFSRFVKSPDYFRDFCRLFRRPHFSCYFSRANSRFVFIDSSSTNSALSVVSFFRFFSSHFRVLFRIFKLLFAYLFPSASPGLRCSIQQSSQLWHFNVNCPMDLSISNYISYRILYPGSSQICYYTKLTFLRLSKCKSTRKTE